MNLWSYLKYKLQRFIKSIKLTANSTITLALFGFIIGVCICKLLTLLSLLTLSLCLLIIIITYVSLTSESLVLVLRRSKVIIKTMLLLSLSISVGILYTNSWDAKVTKEINTLNNSGVKNYGTLVEPVETSLYSDRSVVKLENVSSFALIDLPKYPKFQYKDKVYIQGFLQVLDTKKYEEGYLNYLNSKRIYFELKPKEVRLVERNKSINSLLTTFKQDILTKVNYITSKPASSLVGGIVLGEKSSFSEELTEALKRTGTSHIVSASGYNVALIYIYLNFLVGILHRRKLYLLGILGVMFYILLIGTYNLPALRAGGLIIYVIVAKLIGRKPNINLALLFSIVALLISYPLYLKNISFQLSVGATLGIFIFNTPINEFLKHKLINANSSSNLKMSENILEVLSSTLAVYITTMPIIILSFGEISIISIIVNMIIVPLVPILTILSILAITISYIKLTLAFTLFSGILNVLSTAILKVIEIFSSLKFASTDKIVYELLFILVLYIFLLYCDYQNFIQLYKLKTIK